MENNTITPAMAPPPGVTSNFINPMSRGDKYLAINCIFLPLAVIALVVRTWTRIFIVRNFRSDDYLMITSLILSIALTGVTLDMLNYGLGRHMWDVPLAHLTPYFLKLNVIAAILYCAATGFTKVSVLIFYLRIFPSRSFHISVWTIVFIAVAYNVASVLANVFSCTPIAKAWDLTIEHGICMNRPVFYFANAGLGIFTDFATVLVPIPWLRRLQMPLRQKIAVGCILAMGCFVGIVSCVRLASLYVLMNSTDLTWATTDALWWCTIELNLGIVGGCVTAMRPFVRRYFPRLLGLSSADYSSSRPTGHPLNSIPREGQPSFTNGSHKYSATLTGGFGNESREHILSTLPVSSKEVDGIVRTVEFDIENSPPHT
ncbi:hypothetical protein ASPWEDRAFT_698138 [Aspergillus wentii DTO 134E9]|uniref:Rhodopsin domain-containing protein n=1 Tax=Aspergillus wentii DTO 134E9 TaxID=1073089 RepID=A0A1L9R9N5_ASPWE|nr:uncharacterized protein ASPWEDRAFT_698138 [Aspergillus wentii DTO 134E9]KAI9926339.1 hypothetical protein MW887_004103 [Aspergillus wentii]OJJ31630.1 hypothetical protein ASPWEDRAFT_698138 [Aspergillus wentii DTO 134E9]